MAFFIVVAKKYKHFYYINVYNSPRYSSGGISIFGKRLITWIKVHRANIMKSPGFLSGHSPM